MLESKTVKAPKIQREPEEKLITLTYRNNKFIPPDPAKPVQVIKGDTLNFKCDTDLKKPKMVITLDEKFFRPAIFTSGGPPVEVIKNLEKRSHYKCVFSGTGPDGKHYSYDSDQGGGYGSFVVP